MSDCGIVDAVADWELRLANLCDSRLAPDADTVDRSGAVPVPNLRALAESGFTAAALRSEDGGLGLDSTALWRLHERISAACGNTWFVLVQHLGACSQIAATDNHPLKERLLPAMSRGEHWVGVAFGHLRRPVPPILAKPFGNGWRITGIAPWMTGWPLLSDCIVGAQLPDGTHLYALVSLAQAAGVAVSAPMPLSAMGATGTVQVEFQDCPIAETDLIRIADPGEMAGGDRANLLKTTAPLLGLSGAALRTARSGLANRPISGADVSLTGLDSERLFLRDRIHSELARPIASTDERTHRRMRSEAIDLAQRCAMASVVVSAGAANTVGHPAQRHLREAAFYAVFQQTSAIASSALECFADRRPR